MRRGSPSLYGLSIGGYKNCDLAIKSWHQEWLNHRVFQLIVYYTLPGYTSRALANVSMAPFNSSILST